jgi:hypothetical protein
MSQKEWRVDAGGATPCYNRTYTHLVLPPLTQHPRNESGYTGLGIDSDLVFLFLLFWSSFWAFGSIHRGVSDTLYQQLYQHYVLSGVVSTHEELGEPTCHPVSLELVTPTIKTNNFTPSYSFIIVTAQCMSL